MWIFQSPIGGFNHVLMEEFGMANNQRLESHMKQISIAQHLEAGLQFRTNR